MILGYSGYLAGYFMDFKDFELIEQAFRDLMIEHNSPGRRYKGIALSTLDIKSLGFLVNVIEKELPEYDIWREIGVGGAPPLFSSRRIFLEMTFEKKSPDIVIVSPEEWMFDWSKLDKRSFWSALSETYGRHNVIVLFAETHESKNIIMDYFNCTNLIGLPIKLWISKHQQR